MTYTIPTNYNFRLHHIRSRFKENVESVLVYMASEIARINECQNDLFVQELNTSIRNFPGNATADQKTINNWRTEISKLFGFVQQGSMQGFLKPGLRANELADNQDLIMAFRNFLFLFQYPGGHIKPHYVANQIQAGIRFKPVKTILRLLDYAQRQHGGEASISKPELTHCVFNDLRCTRDNEDISETWNRIITNRENRVTYITEGDIIRYAGDILDYMVLGDLLLVNDFRRYSLNNLNRDVIDSFISSELWFDSYDNMIDLRMPQLGYITELENEWLDYVNQPLTDEHFQTNVITFIDTITGPSRNDILAIRDEIFSRNESPEGITTLDIGNFGENIIYGHECESLKRNGREDLIHLVKVVPTEQYQGYDILSYDVMEERKHIEVKTTISINPLAYDRFHLTPNEWRAASNLKDEYYIYRLLINRSEMKLFILQNPISMYKQNRILMIPSEGADFTFTPDDTIATEEVLSWTN